MSGSTKKKYCKLLHAITNHALLSVSEEAMQEEEVDKQNFSSAMICSRVQLNCT